MRQIATKRSFFEPPVEFASSALPPIVEFNHMLVLALERARVPPVVHSRSTFQPMRVIVVNPALSAWRGASGAVGAEMPGLLPRVLPPAVLISNPASNLSHRAVRGEILSDERGQLYEKLGRQIRPIHQLASGPSGEVIDLVPTPQSNSRTTTVRREPVASTETTERQSAEEEGSTSTHFEKPTLESLKQTAQRSESASHRKLFADPGQWRVVWWGEFKEILARQLAHPERLRDTYRLPCYIQVLETERAVAIEELAAVYNADNKGQTPLYLLTDEIAAKLDLVLPLRPAPARSARRTPNILGAHERVFRLLAANDPTIDVATLKNKQPTLSNPEDKERAKTVEPTAGGALVKEAIPSRFVKEWEFRISREEAIYDLNAKPTIGSVICDFFRRLRIVKTRNAIGKWQTLLAGRSGDEQLWAVRPPANMLADPFVCDWATRALELAGYNSQKMFREWQIFWRRKGH